MFNGPGPMNQGNANFSANNSNVPPNNQGRVPFPNNNGGSNFPGQDPRSMNNAPMGANPNMRGANDWDQFFNQSGPAAAPNTSSNNPMPGNNPMNSNMPRNNVPPGNFQGNMNSNTARPMSGAAYDPTFSTGGRMPNNSNSGSSNAPYNPANNMNMQSKRIVFFLQ